jgi:DNA-binding NarL/FixJ family response regulator
MNRSTHGRTTQANAESVDRRKESSLSLTIALIDMPRMLREIVDEALSRHDVRLIDETRNGDGLVGAIDRTGAGLVIVSSERVGPTEVCRLLSERPAVKVFAIARNGRDGCLYEQRPNLVLVDDLSPTNLAETVLGSSDGTSRTRTTTENWR